MEDDDPSTAFNYKRLGKRFYTKFLTPLGKFFKFWRSLRLRLTIPSKLRAVNGQQYKRLVVFVVVFVIIFGGATGIYTRLYNARSVQTSLPVSNSPEGKISNLADAAAITASLPIERSGPQYAVHVHKVEKSEGLDSIADDYSISPETIMWANSEVHNLDKFESEIKPGKRLRIPDRDGVLYKVSDKDTLSTVMKKVEGGNIIEVLAVNSISGKGKIVEEVNEVFIPEAELITPPKPKPQPQVRKSAPVIQYAAPNANLGSIKFVNPLSHPSCSGYYVSRGLVYQNGKYHNGVDLPKAGGCIIRAAAEGVVKYVGWYGGHSVIIDHGGGVESHYYHGNGVFYVSQGQSVSAGQQIMYMGGSGNTTAVHLHFSLFQHGRVLSPFNYISF